VGFDLILFCLRRSYLICCRSDFGLRQTFFRESPFSGVGVGENLILDKDNKNG
jgi:hypothetical protein